MTPTTRIAFWFAGLLAVAGVFGLWVGGSPASLATGLLLAAAVAGLALAGHRGWRHAWLASLGLAVLVTGGLGLLAGGAGSVTAAALALAALVTVIAFGAPRTPERAT